MKKYALGIDIGGTNIKYIILDNSGIQIDHFSNKAEFKMGGKHVLKNVIEGAKLLIKKNKNIKIEGIGVGSPGLISKDGKVITGASNLKDWAGIDIKGNINKHIKLPLFIDNDVTLVALGEAYFGAGKKYNRVICLALGTGLGGGIVLNKHIYRGKYGYAGEFGHVVINPRGPLCSCGKRGCLERYASASGLKQLAKKYIQKNKQTKILKYAGSIKNITPIHIYNAFRKNDAVAKKIIEDMSYYTGMGIGMLVNIFDPDIIIIAGGISREGKLLLDLIYKHLYKFTLPFYKNKVNIKLSKFKDKSGVIGTASLVFEELRIPV